MVNDEVGFDLVREIARPLVAELAPEEAPLFGPLSAAYFRDPESASRAGGQREEVLGMGIEAAAVMVTPVVLAVVLDAARHLAQRLATDTGEQGARLIESRVATLLSRLAPKPAARAVPALTAGQLAEVRTHAYERARAMRLSEARAALLADALVGSLVAPQT